MKVNLSRYVNGDCIVAAVLVIAVVIFSIYSCFWCAGRGMDELILAIIPCAFIYVGIMVWALYNRKISYSICN